MEVGTGTGSGAPTSSDQKQLLRFLYSLIKQLDDRKQLATTSSQLFTEEIALIRERLIAESEKLIFQPIVAIGKRSREILWRKGFYEFISLTKRFSATSAKGKASPSNEFHQSDAIIKLIFQGIAKYKAIIVQMELDYNLDLRNIVDFTLLDQTNDSVVIMPNGHNTDCNYTLELINFALETVHAALLSLGDLHRYFIDFNFDKPQAIRRDFAAKYYFEAFKLNPKIGMAHNQLGTLYSGQCYDLDSTYHYLYSLVCPIPFELSEINVSKIFVANVEYLEKVEEDKMGVTIRDFVARFKLIADIFFYDKEVTDFNALCHCTLTDLRTILTSKRSQLNDDFLFKIVAILLFCLTKLKSGGSPKVYSLNAFLMAICAELIDSCILNLEKYVAARDKQNEAFQEAYSVFFDLYDRDVRRSRETHRMLMNDGIEKSISPVLLVNGTTSARNSPTVSNDSVQKSSLSSVSPMITDFKSQASLKSKSAERNEPHASSNAGMGASSNEKEGQLSSDAKTPSSLPVRKKSAASSSLGDGNKRNKPTKLRRRRRKLQSGDTDEDSDAFSEDDDDDLSGDESDYDMNSDFSSDDSSYENSFMSTDDEEEDVDGNAALENGAEKLDVAEIKESNDAVEPTVTVEFQQYSDSEDIIIEEEKIIYLNDLNTIKTEVKLNNQPKRDVIANYTALDDKMLNFCLTDPDGDDDKDVVIEEEDDMLYGHTASAASMNDLKSSELINGNVFKEISNLLPSNNSSSKDDNARHVDKLRYKRKYTKIDPNILIEFAQQECTIKSLKILFDWLKVNSDILHNCYSSNPEFIHKIMKLLNHLNIDIFTRKVCFDRNLIKVDNVRTELRTLFDIRMSIPLYEDVLLKDFSLLEPVQQNMDFEIPLQMKITVNEENIMRVFKLVDFGFFICKTKKFRYNFCARSRRFIAAKENIGGRNGGGSFVAGSRGGANGRQQKRSKRRRGFAKRRNENGQHGKRIRARSSYTSNEENDFMIEPEVGPIGDDGLKVPRKSYLKNRNYQQINVVATEKEIQKSLDNGVDSKKTVESKSEIMGKLWLRNEVKTLESKMSKRPATVLTPYLVLDSKSLTDYASTVKTLIKTKKFVVLIPNAVLSDLDELKKTSEGARNAIRWLEAEFSKGSRFLRLQRNYETLPIALLKVPRKMDRDASTFLQIAQFCNYMQANHSDGSDHRILTLLTGTNIKDKKSPNFSFTGVMDAVSVHFEQISTFFAKYKKK